MASRGQSRTSYPSRRAFAGPGCAGGLHQFYSEDRRCRSTPPSPMTTATSSRASCAARSRRRRSTRTISPRLPRHQPAGADPYPGDPQGRLRLVGRFLGEGIRCRDRRLRPRGRQVARDRDLVAPGYRLLANTGGMAGRRCRTCTSTCSAGARWGRCSRTEDKAPGLYLNDRAAIALGRDQAVRLERPYCA
jgi:hypothetical protein